MTKKKPRLSGVFFCRSSFCSPLDSAPRLPEACLIARPAFAKAQRMGQLVNAGRWLADDSGLLGDDVATFSHGLPRDVPRERIENPALHDPASQTPSVRNIRTDEGFLPRCHPLVRKQAAHPQFPRFPQLD